MILLVSGSREYGNVEVFAAIMDKALRYFGAQPEEIIHGGCTGVDALAVHWASLNRVHCRPFLADWSTGRKAGPDRNGRMVEAASHAMFLLDGRGVDGEGKVVGKGTRDCLGKWLKTGKPTWVCTVKP